MSFEAMNLMLDQSKATGQHRAVGVAIASYANGDWLAWPKNPELRRWGFSERTIQRGLRKLEELGELLREKALEVHGRERVYRVLPAARGQMSLLDPPIRAVGGGDTLTGGGDTQTPPVTLAPPVSVSGGGVCLARAREGTQLNPINVKGTPLAPQGGKVGEAELRSGDEAPARPAGRRQRDTEQWLAAVEAWAIAQGLPAEHLGQIRMAAFASPSHRVSRASVVAHLERWTDWRDGGAEISEAAHA